MRVALFLTCVNDTLYPDTGRAVISLLSRLGVDVEFPAGQTCCGQAHYNTGYRKQAEPLARHMPRRSPSTTTWSLRRGRAARWCGRSIRVWRCPTFPGHWS